MEGGDLLGWLWKIFNLQVDGEEEDGPRMWLRL